MPPRPRAQGTRGTRTPIHEEKRRVPGGRSGALTLLAALLERLSNAHAEAREKALEIAERLLAPAGPIPQPAVRRLLARARRNGAWPMLPRETRALLAAAAAAEARVYRSPVLLALLRRAWLLVEQATARGKAVVAALTHLLATAPHRLAKILARGLDALIALGVQLLNHPLLTPQGA